MDSFIREHKHADICVAVSTAAGLITPIIPRAEQKGKAKVLVASVCVPWLQFSLTSTCGNFCILRAHALFSFAYAPALVYKKH